MIRCADCKYCDCERMRCTADPDEAAVISDKDLEDKTGCKLFVKIGNKENFITD